MSANGRVGATAAVYTAAILGKKCWSSQVFDHLFSVAVSNVVCSEYLTAEVLELAGNASKDLKVCFIASPQFRDCFPVHN